MCLTTQAMYLFVSILSPDVVSPSASQILIQAQTGSVVWENYGDLWCIDGPPSEQQQLRRVTDDKPA